MAEQQHPSKKVKEDLAAVIVFIRQARVLARDPSRGPDLELAIIRARRHARDLDRALFRDYPRARDLAIALVRYLTLELDRDRGPALDHELAHALDLARDLARALNLDPDRDLDLKSVRPPGETLTGGGFVGNISKSGGLAHDLVSKESELSLDASIPGEVIENQTFDIAVQIRRPETEILDEPDMDIVQSKMLVVYWQAEQQYIPISVQILAPECQIVSSDIAKIQLRRDRDSPVIYFTLRPHRLGSISIIVRAFRDDDVLIGSVRLTTNSVREAATRLGLRAFTDRLLSLVSEVNEKPEMESYPLHPYDGIPGETLISVYQCLLDCAPVKNDQALKSVFIDDRIAHWADGLPEADNALDRVKYTVFYMAKRFLGESKENGLVLLLTILGEQTDKADLCHRRLLSTAQQVQSQLWGAAA